MNTHIEHLFMQTLNPDPLQSVIHPSSVSLRSFWWR